MARMVTHEDQIFYDKSSEYFKDISKLLEAWDDEDYDRIEEQLKRDQEQLVEDLRAIDEKRRVVRVRADTIERIRGSLFAARDIHKNFTQDFEKEN